MATETSPVEPAEREKPPGQREPPRRQAGGGGRLWVLVAIALMLLGIGAILLSTSFDKPRELKTLGRNLPVNEGARNPLDLSSQNSPTLRRNPVDSDNLVVANRIDSPRYSCALHVSFDGGGRWAQTPIPAPAGEEPKCYAPDVVFAANGTLYLVFVTLKGRANAPNAVWLSTSIDGGKTLSTPVKAPLGKLAFQVRLVADPTVPRRLYLTWLQASDVGLYRFPDTGNPIRAIRSDDGGRTWTRPTQASSAARERVVAPTPALGPGGQLYVLYLDLGEDRLDYEGAHRGRGGPPYDGPWQLVLARSTDRGGTWGESVVEDELTPTERFIVFTPPSPSLVVDRESGKVYAAFHDGRHGDSDVNLWSLPEGSSSWIGPKRVNDTPQRDGTTQYLPQLALAPDGRLDVTYYDRRGDRTDVLNEVSLQSSFDEGESFTRHVRLSDQPFSSRIGFGSERGMPDLGSRLGLISTDSRAFAVWTDTRAGTRTTGKQDLARGLVAYSDPPRLAGWLELLLRLGGIGLILAGVAVLVFGVARLRPARS